MMTNSRAPVCTNELSPWPKIEFSDLNPRSLCTAEPADQSAILPECDQRSGWPRKRGMSNFGFRSLTSGFGHRKSLSSSNQPKIDDESVHANVASGGRNEVSAKQAVKKRGRPILQPFQSRASSSISQQANQKRRDGNGDVGKQSSEADRPRINSIDKRPDNLSQAVSQGHTANLCSFMQLQKAEGLLILADFSACNIHPAMVDPLQTSTDLRTSQVEFDTPGSSNSSSKHVASVSAFSPERSTWAETDLSSLNSPGLKSHSKIWPTLDGSLKNDDLIEEGDLFLDVRNEDITSTRPSTYTDVDEEEEEEEDPFLYLGMQGRSKRRQLPPAFDTRGELDQSHWSHCKCTNHHCLTFLSGNESKHCCDCRLPRAQPEIAAAMSRLGEVHNAMVSNSNNGEIMRQESEASEDLQNDLILVEMYNAEMEKRCESGVWWEGWLVVDELRRQGIVGSKRHKLEVNHVIK